MAYSRLEVERLLCAIYPTRYERLLGRVGHLLWRISETGPTGWLGDRLDDYQTHYRDQRARRNVARLTKERSDG